MASRKHAFPIGRKVLIIWNSPRGDLDDDWSSYRVLAVEHGMVLLQGLDIGPTTYVGGPGWVQLSSIEWMEVCD